MNDPLLDILRALGTISQRAQDLAGALPDLGLAAPVLVALATQVNRMDRRLAAVEEGLAQLGPPTPSAGFGGNEEI